MKRKRPPSADGGVLIGETDCAGDVLHVLRRWWKSEDDRPHEDTQYRHGDWAHIIPLVIYDTPADSDGLLHCGNHDYGRLAPAEGYALYYHHCLDTGQITVYGGKMKKRGKSLKPVHPDALTMSRYIKPRDGETFVDDNAQWYSDPCAFGDGEVGDAGHMFYRLGLMNTLVKAFRSSAQSPPADSVDARMDIWFPSTSDTGRHSEAYGKAGTFLLALIDNGARQAIALAEGLMEKHFLERRCTDEWRLLDVCIARNFAFVHNTGMASPSFMLDRRKCATWDDRFRNIGGLRLFGKDARAYVQHAHSFYSATPATIDNRHTLEREEADDDMQQYLWSALTRHAHVWNNADRPLVVFCIPAADALNLCETATCATCNNKCPRTRPVIYRGEALVTWRDCIAACVDAVSANLTVLVSVLEQRMGTTDFITINSMCEAAKKAGHDKSGKVYDEHIHALAAVQDVRPHDRDVRRRNLVCVAHERAWRGLHEVLIPRCLRARDNIHRVNPIVLGDVLDDRVLKECTELTIAYRDSLRLSGGALSFEQRNGLPGSKELIEADYDIRKLQDVMPPCLRAIINKGTHPNYHERCILGSFMLRFDAFLPMTCSTASRAESDQARVAFVATWQRLFVQHPDAKKRSQVMSNFRSTEYGDPLIKDLVNMRKGKGLFHGCNFAVSNGVCPFSSDDGAEFCKRTGVPCAQELLKRVFDIVPAADICGTELCRHRCERFFVADNDSAPNYPIQSPVSYYRYSHAIKRAIAVTPAV